MLLGFVPIKTWLIAGIYIGTGLSHHTQVVIVGRDTCHALALESWRLVWPPYIGLLGIIPCEYWTGLSLFRACQFFASYNTSFDIQSKRTCGGITSKKLVSLLQVFRAVQHGTGCPYCCPVVTMTIWGHILVSVRDSESCGTFAHCTNGLLTVTFNVMTLAWDMKSLVRKLAAWAINWQL